jgi:hypothetical protein
MRAGLFGILSPVRFVVVVVITAVPAFVVYSRLVPGTAPAIANAVLNA